MAKTCIFLYTGPIKRPNRMYSPTEMERCNVPHVAFRSISETSIGARAVGTRLPPQQGRMGRVALRRRAMAIHRKVASQARQVAMRRHSRRSHPLTRMDLMATMVLMVDLETPRPLQDMAHPRNKAHPPRMDHMGKGNMDNQLHPVAMGSPRRRAVTASPMASLRRRVIR